MLKTILSISGKPGLYKLVSHGKNMLIVESLTDNKRVPAYAKDKVISLGDIAIYTDETEVPLHEVLTSVKNKEEGKAASLVPSTATTDLLRAYFAEVLPSYDRERVYPSDIKKLLSWYNILINAGITDFTPKDAPAEKETAEKETKYQHTTKRLTKGPIDTHRPVLFLYCHINQQEHLCKNSPLF